MFIACVASVSVQFGIKELQGAPFFARAKRRKLCSSLFAPRKTLATQARMFIAAVQFCEFGLYLVWMVRSRLSVPAQFKIVAEILFIEIEYDLVALPSHFVVRSSI